MAQHIRTAGILQIVYASISILIGLFLLLILGGLATFVSTQDRSPDALVGATVLGGVGIGLFVLMAVLAAPAMIAGIALLRGLSWGRVLTIVVAALELLSFPLGTALGIYCLWVMVQPETERLLNARPDVAGAPHVLRR
ncbi:MAG: hypothetical protein KJZ84_12190 [Bryobacteraceae bacterium]|nr:hypothetical protein [Bryobacteraceae bacterium]